jgi:hypothetical protein
MKFFETQYGDLINVDEIAKVTTELHEQLGIYFSYVWLKNEEKIDFIEFSKTFNIYKNDKVIKEVKLQHDHYFFMNIRALEYIITSNSLILSNEEVKEYAQECLNDFLLSIES